VNNERSNQSVKKQRVKMENRELTPINTPLNPIHTEKMDAEQNNNIEVNYYLLKADDVNDITLMQNSYNQSSRKCIIYAKINKSDHLILIEIDNIALDITLEKLTTLFNQNNENSFDFSQYLFAYGIYVNNTDTPSANSHNPIFKLFDKSCFIIKDIITAHSNIHLIENKHNEPIQQKNGLILQPRFKNNCNISNHTDHNNKIQTVTLNQSLPTITTINKHIAPKITVLVVEDNPINCKILSKILKKHKIHYKLAKNGLEAIETYCLRRN